MKPTVIFLIGGSLLLTVLSLQVEGSLISLNHNDDPNLSLEERISIEKSTFHWYPYQKIMYTVLDDGSSKRDCPETGSSIEQFPIFFTREQRLYQGLIVIHFLVAIYLFIFLAFVIDKYFIPSVERICEVLKITPDVAACTFMATATAMPEFFTNTVSIFIAESDMGLGAVIGSMLYNTLGVAAIASLFTKKPIQVDWWPITRDSLMFAINISILVGMSWDGVIMWWEATILTVLFVLYYVLMFQNKFVVKYVKTLIEDKFMWCQRIKNYDVENQRPKEIKPPMESNRENVPSPMTENFNDEPRDSFKGLDNPGFKGSGLDVGHIEAIKAMRTKRAKSFDIDAFDIPSKPRERRQSFDLSRIDDSVDQEEFKIWELPRGVSVLNMIWYFLTWPIRFILHYTIPNPIKHKKWFAVSFIMCIVWIGPIAYMTFWMAVVIGDTFQIPEPVMGFTLLAFGGCMPEAISATIVMRNGSGQMGVSNSLGTNSIAILFSLGMPWFIRTMADGAGFTGAHVKIGSEGTQFLILGLLLGVALLYATVSIAGYKFRKTVGGFLGLWYLILATVAVLIELDIIFDLGICY